MTLSKLKDGTLLDVSRVIRVKIGHGGLLVILTWDNGTMFYYQCDTREEAESLIEEIYELSTKAVR